MKTISLICSFHEERGCTSISELHGILEYIQPEVIFLEVPAEWRGDSYLLKRTNNLESNAVARYIVGLNVELVPVDLPTPDESFFRKARDFFEVIERHSYEYCNLIDKNKERMIGEGFSYLNSESSNKHHSDLNSAIITAIESLGRKWLADYYAEWRGLVEQRDIEMLSRIESYCKDNDFGRAVFLVGAAHRASIMDKSSKWVFPESAEVLWDYLGALPHDQSLQARRP